MINSVGGKFDNFGIKYSFNTQQSYGLTSASKPDEFVKENKDNKKNKLKLKVNDGFSILGFITIALFLIDKSRLSEVKKLAKHIDFKPAETIQEAVKFGKKHLGIKQYSGFDSKDIDALNWINEGIVNTSNKLKGRLRIPKHVCYSDELKENTLASVLDNHRLRVNKKIFENIDKTIEEKLSFKEKVVKFTKNSDGKWQYDAHKMVDKKSLDELLKLFIDYKKPNATFKDKMKFYSSLNALDNSVNSYNESPLCALIQLLKDSKVKNICRENGISTDIEHLKSLSSEEQFDIIKKLVNNGVDYKIKFDVNSLSIFNIIYHEMGHVQDMQPRCPTIAKLNYDPSKYPESLKMWVNNNLFMQIANSVSSYSSYGPGEFIAETFAEMISGVKLSDEVLALYKKLNGPKVVGY